MCRSRSRAAATPRATGPGQEESTLFHKVPDRDMLGFFRDNDWSRITGGAPDGYLELAGVCVPFVTR